jgi:MtN3 and saliva related transmembrane protein
MSASGSQLLGTAATAYGVIAPLSALLQARQMLARRSSREVSVRFFASYAGGYAIWLLYGLSAGSTPLIVVDAVGVLCAGLTLAVALALRGSLARLAGWTGRSTIPVAGEGPEPAPAAIANAVARQVSSKNQATPANPERASGARVIDRERPGAAMSQVPVRCRSTDMGISG